MSHLVTGLIGKPEPLAAFAQRHSLHDPVPLMDGLALLPLRDEDFASFLPAQLGDYPEGFRHLSAQLSSALSDASAGVSLMYFETEYFGGMGFQGAAVFRDGALVFGPQSADIGPINQALALLGVRVTAPAHDEFETVGLHRHRHTDGWLESGA